MSHTFPVFGEKEGEKDERQEKEECRRKMLLRIIFWHSSSGRRIM
jgi:hypothetical protein